MGINSRYITNKDHTGFTKFIQGSYNKTEKKKMRCLYKKPEASYWNKFRIRTTPKGIQYELEGHYMDITKVHTRRKEGRRRRRRRRKTGP